MKRTHTAALVLVLAVLLAGSAYALTAGPFDDTTLVAALGDSRFHNEAGYRLGQEGSWEGAAREFRVALVLDPSSVSARQNLAIASFHTGEYETAIAEYRTLLEQDPGQRQYRFDLAQSLVAHARTVEDDPAEAIAQLEEALTLLERDPSYPHARENAHIIRAVLTEAGVALSE